MDQPASSVRLAAGSGIVFISSHTVHGQPGAYAAAQRDRP
jgi:hypothetical protein